MFAIIHWSPNPIIVEIGSFALRWYSLLFATGFVVGFFILKKRFEEEGVGADVLDKMLLYSVVGTILGARIGNCFFYEWTYFSEHPAEILLPFKWDSEFEFTGYRGLASHGAMFGLLLSYYLLSRQTGKSILWFLDKCGLVAALSLACIRLGNLMNSEILGTPFDGAWAFIFERLPGLEGQTPRHPVQIYSFVVYFCLFLFMQWYYKQNFSRVKDGHIFAVFLAILGQLRIGMEFIKEHYIFSDESFFNMAQYLSLPMVIGGLILAYFTKQKNEKTV